MLPSVTRRGAELCTGIEGADRCEVNISTAGQPAKAAWPSPVQGLGVGEGGKVHAAESQADCKEEAGWGLGRG